MSRNTEHVASFISYCAKHPDERFWQALRNWSGWSYIYVSNGSGPGGEDVIDTFYWEGGTKMACKGKPKGKKK